MPKKGYKPTEEHKNNIALSLIGNKNSLGFCHPKEFGQKISKSCIGKKKPWLQGEKSPNWKGGTQIRVARNNTRRRNLGFIPIINKNPYNEPVEWHHLFPNLPFVIPVPERIHQMFNCGNDISHYQNVFAFMGFKKIEVPFDLLIKELR